MLISHAIWTRRYQPDPAVLGRRILVNGVPAVILGVMPERFEFPEVQKLWIPLGPLAAKDSRNNRSLFTFARLSPRTSRSTRCTAELKAVTATLASAVSGHERELERPSAERSGRYSFRRTSRSSSG